MNFAENKLHLLHQLEGELAVTQREQATAQAMVTALTTRLAGLQDILKVAQADFASAAADAGAMRDIAQAFDENEPRASEARRQAGVIVASILPLLQNAYATAVAFSLACPAIDELAAQVARRTGKNELVSPTLVSGVARLQSDAATAGSAFTQALQKTILAFAAANEAQQAADAVGDAGARLHRLLSASPNASPASSAPDRPPVRSEPASLAALADATRSGECALLAVFAARQEILARSAEEWHAVLTQTTLALVAATSRLNDITARLQATQAALAAARATVVEGGGAR